MAKAIEQVKNLTIGHAALGYRGGVAGSVRQQVHDGDTINVRAVGNFGVRFLGIENTSQILRPENYYTIPNPEDRLFVPEEYVPLFTGTGWRTQAQ